MKKKLKLFVWENVLYDYTAGLAVALAENVTEARALLTEKIGYSHEDLAKEPLIVEEPAAFYVYGGS